MLVLLPPRQAQPFPAAQPLQGAAAGHLQLSLLCHCRWGRLSWDWGCSALLPPHQPPAFSQTRLPLLELTSDKGSCVWLSTVSITNHSLRYKDRTLLPYWKRCFMGLIKMHCLSVYHHHPPYCAPCRSCSTRASDSVILYWGFWSGRTCLPFPQL